MTIKKEELSAEIEKMPDSMFEELFDFYQYLKSKNMKEKMETLITSESSLKKDWLTKEENAAWQDL